jgi:hypothetical protein
MSALAVHILAAGGSVPVAKCTVAKRLKIRPYNPIGGKIKLAWQEAKIYARILSDL